MGTTLLISPKLTDHLRGRFSKEYIENLLLSPAEITPLEYQSAAESWRAAEIEFSQASHDSIEEKAAIRRMIELMSSPEEFPRTRQLLDFRDNEDQESILFLRKLNEILNKE
jgi:hypothetical protein